MSADNQDATILDSDADWIAPAARFFPPSNSGGDQSRRKVVVNDSDHSYFGMWNESPLENRKFFWINFTNGHQTMFMDPYLVHYPREKRNVCPSVVHGIGRCRTRVGIRCGPPWGISAFTPIA